MDDYSCRSCGDYLTGRQKLFCSEKCRKRHARAEARFKGMNAAEADRRAREERAADEKRWAEKAAQEECVRAQRGCPCPVCGERIQRARGERRGRIKTYCSVACRSKAQRERIRQQQSERETVDAFDLFLAQCTQENEGHRLTYGAKLSSFNERIERLEETALRAAELAAENDDPHRCNTLLRDVAELRDKVNAMYAEIEKPCPDWGIFFV